MTASIHSTSAARIYSLPPVDPSSVLARFKALSPAQQREVLERFQEKLGHYNEESLRKRVMGMVEGIINRLIHPAPEEPSMGDSEEKMLLLFAGLIDLSMKRPSTLSLVPPPGETTVSPLSWADCCDRLDKVLSGLGEHLRDAAQLSAHVLMVRTRLNEEVIYSNPLTYINRLQPETRKFLLNHYTQEELQCSISQLAGIFNERLNNLMATAEFVSLYASEGITESELADHRRNLLIIADILSLLASRGPNRRYLLPHFNDSKRATQTENARKKFPAVIEDIKSRISGGEVVLPSSIDLAAIEEVFGKPEEYIASSPPFTKHSPTTGRP